jgi:YaiO family outer membrane protein
MNTFSLVIAFLLFLAAYSSSDAQDWKDLDPDELFSIARKEVLAGNKTEGHEKLKYILKKSPGYDDVKIFLAKSYAWDGLYEEARTELRPILQKNPSHRDAVYALIDVELWSHNFNDALEVTRKASLAYPGDTNLLYKEARALVFLARSTEALLTLEKLLHIAPAHETGKTLYDSINFHSRIYTANVISGTEFFSRVFNPSYYITAQLSRRNSWGSSHVRFNYTKRFNTHGSQFEVDLYPRISKSIFAYFNYGYSASVLFPENRIGVELFFKVPKSLETSAGVRYMAFDRDTRILIYTGSVGWYFSNYWLSIRPFIIPDYANGTSVSAMMSARRYFRHAENYVELSAGLGFSPDVRGMQKGTGLSENELYLLKSHRVGLVFQTVFGTTWTINLSFDLARQELIFDQNEYVFITSTFVSLRKKI